MIALLEFITGTNRESKRKHIGSLLASAAESGKKATLVVPDQSAFDRDRDFLFVYGDMTANKVKITGFTHAAEDILCASARKIKPQADDRARLLIMSIAAEDASDVLQVYSGHSEKASLVTKLLRQYETIKYSGNEISVLTEAALSAGDTPLGRKLTDLSEIFTRFEAKLGERFSDKTDNLPVAADIIEKGGSREKEVWIFDDFRIFTGVQYKFIGALLNKGAEVFVSLTIPLSDNKSYATDRGFEIKNRLFSFAKRNNLTARETNTDEKDDCGPFAPMRNRLYAVDPGCGSTGEKDRVTVISATDRYAECDSVAREIKRLIREKGYRCRDFAVLERTGVYSPILRSSLKKYGLPVYDDTSVPLVSYPPVRLIFSAVDSAVFGFRTDDVLAVAKTGMTDITPEQLEDFENYVRIWQIGGNAFLSPFTFNPDGFGAEKDESTNLLLKNLNETRKKLISPLKILKDTLSHGTGEENAKAVYEYLTGVNCAKHFLKHAEVLANSGDTAGAVACSGVWKEITDSLDALYSVLGSDEIKPSRFAELLRMMFRCGSIGTIPAGIDEIEIGNMERSRFPTPAVTFVLGFNQGLVPLETAAQDFFTPAEKRLLRESPFSIGDTAEDTYSDECATVYAALTSPSEQLYLSYSLTDTSGSGLEVSQLLDDIREIYPVSFMSADPASPEDAAMSPASAFELFAKETAAGTPLADVLEEYLSGRPEYAGKVEAVKRAGKVRKNEITDKDTAIALFGKDMTLSASRIDNYYSCPFGYFCRYGMDVYPLEPAQLSARISGLLVHYVFQRLFDGHSQEELISTGKNDAYEMLDSYAEEYVARYLEGREKLPQTIIRQLDNKIKEIHNIYDRIITGLENSSFTVRDVELGIGKDGPIKAYSVEADDGSTITLTGMVDRVDICELDGKKYLRVIDYKTGKNHFVLNDIFAGKNLQMPLYLNALIANGKERYGANILPAGILYFPAKEADVKLGRYATSDEIEEKRLSSRKLEGIILKSEQMLEAMDRTKSGSYIDHKLAGNELKGAYLSGDDFTLLGRKTDGILRQTAGALHDGRTEIMPLRQVSEKGAIKKTACDSCKYGSICLHGNEDEFKILEYSSHESALKKLKEEAE